MLIVTVPSLLFSSRPPLLFRWLPSDLPSFSSFSFRTPGQFSLPSTIWAYPELPRLLGFLSSQDFLKQYRLGNHLGAYWAITSSHSQYLVQFGMSASFSFSHLTPHLCPLKRKCSWCSIWRDAALIHPHSSISKSTASTLTSAYFRGKLYSMVQLLIWM